ncbi:MAG TPA: MFS transporter [Gemmatimonadota bacterium]|nr:MFS transporter [Gemmatimonadota bacterium]
MSEEGLPRGAFAGLFVANGAAMLGLGIILPILSPYLERLGATGFAVGLVFAGYALARGILGPLAGRFSDLAGRKRVLVAGLLLYTALTPFYPAASSVVVVAGLWFLQGAASALVTPIAQSYIGDITPEGREGEVMNLFYVSLFSGVAIGPFLGGWLSDHVSPAAPFYAMGAAALLALVPVLAAVPGGKPPEPRGSGEPAGDDRRGAGGTREALAAVLSDRPVRGILAYITTRGFYRWGFNSFFPLFAVRAVSLSRSQVGLVLSGYMLTGSFLQYPLGRLVDRWSDRRAGFVALGGLLAALSMAAVPAVHGLWALLAVVLAMGVSSAVSRASVVAVRTERGRAFGQGAVTGIYTAGLSVGQVAGPVGFGAVVPLLHIGGAFELGAGAGVLGTVAAWWLLRGPRPPVGRPGPAR